MSGIDKIITNSEKFELSGKDILRITDNKCSILTYEQLEQFETIDDALGEFGAIILLYETKKFNEGHWTALFKVNETTLEFFDSYGLCLDCELKIAPEFNVREHNGVLVPHLTKLVNTSHYTKLIYNKTQFQKIAKDVNTCGRYTALRVRMRDLPLKTYTDYLTKNKCYDSDFWVSSMTLLV